MVVVKCNGVPYTHLKGTRTEKSVMIAGLLAEI